MLRFGSRLFVGVFAVCACATQPTGDPSVTLKQTGADAIKVVATSADGTIGKGTVTFSSTTATLGTNEVELDAYGSAQAQFTCDAAVQPLCAQPYSIEVRWLVAGVPVRTSVQISPASSGTGGDGGTQAPIFSAATLMLGPLSAGACWNYVLADPRRPTDVRAQFSCDMRIETAKLFDGQLYYALHVSDTFGQPTYGIHRFRADPFEKTANGGSRFPTEDKFPDEVIFPSCSAVFDFWISPDGKFLHHCSNQLMLSIDGVATNVSRDNTLAFGNDGAILKKDALVTSDGVSHPISTPLESPSLAVADGFLATKSAPGFTSCDLFHVAMDGTLELRGSYPVDCRGAQLQRDGKLTYAVYSTGRVFEMMPGGTPTEIYSQADATQLDWSVYPPKLYVLMGRLVGAN